ncbi:DNA kinase/phosphatase Pnk1 [Rhizina undulata]
MPRAAKTNVVKQRFVNEGSSSQQLKKMRSTTTKYAVANFFKPISQKEPEKTTWKLVHNTLLVGKYFNKDGTNNQSKDGSLSIPITGEVPKRKIAGFDLDSTLIVTQSGNRHANTETDWRWWHASVPEKLRSLHDEGYQIVIFSNQAGIRNPKKESVMLRKFKLKTAAMLDALDIPLILYAATGHDEYRKPRTGMWDELKDNLNLGVDGADMSASYFVGDAAGREGDFSDSDRFVATSRSGFKFFDGFDGSEIPPA